MQVGFSGVVPGRSYHNDLHPRAEPRRKRCAEPRGRAVALVVVTNFLQQKRSGSRLACVYNMDGILFSGAETACVLCGNHIRRLI